MKTISIDIETKSGEDISRNGVYRYTQSPDFAILLFGYAVDGGEVNVIDLAHGERIPKDVLEALTDERVEKWAFNANFERVCLSRYLSDLGMSLDPFADNHPLSTECGQYLSPRGWRCTMVWAAYMGLPLSLAAVGSVLGLEEQKLSEGKALIRQFCNPPFYEPDGEKWDLFKAYNKRDVEVEIAIQRRLAKYPVPDSVWEEYELDQEINDRGILVDTTLAENAILMDGISQEKLKAAMQELTELDNPNSVAQMKAWLAKNGMETDTLGKKVVAELLKDAPEPLRTVLSLRQQMAKSSVKKYQAMKNTVCEDNRVRGMFQFYGANRTGRWAGRHVQLQNLPQNHISDLESARDLTKQGCYTALECLYDSVPDVLSQLIRTAFIPKPGRKFVVADFSAIEARVLSWLAGEKWRMDVFRDGGDIYCATASRMFHCKVEKHGENGHLRQKGKQAELACIAEGQLVLTDMGLVPIERVTKAHRLWDGEKWVCHDGVIFKGEREVITYEGLTATPDHLVWVEGESEPIRFGDAAASGARLIQTGDGGTAIRLGEDYKPGEALEQDDESLLCVDPMHRLRFYTMDELQQSSQREVKRMPKLLPAAKDSTLVGQEAHGGKATLRKSARPGISELWRTGHQVRFRQRDGSWTLPYRGTRRHSSSRDADRSHRHQRKLHPGEYAVRDSIRESGEPQNHSSFRVSAEVLAIQSLSGVKEAGSRQEPQGDYQGSEEGRSGKAKELARHQRTARLYDIQNAGPHHRFTVSGRLVHNCGYGGSVGALKAFGALESGMKEEELKPLVDAWREANINIVSLWYAVDDAAKRCIRERVATSANGITFSYQSGMMFIILPSGRRLSYVKPRIGENQFGGESVTYMGLSVAKKWSRLETFGGKLVENIVQAISRDILAYAMRTLRYTEIVAHVHDEVIIECDKRTPVDIICQQMSRTPPWARGLLLRADGYECDFYKKD